MGSNSNIGATELESLYERALPSTRSGTLYGAFPYPTKISPETIALYIAAHTDPGDTVFDGFAGSGTTGLAALLCENPPEHLQIEAKRLGLKVKWGSRNAVLYEIGALGSFVANTLTNPPDPDAFLKAATEILCESDRLDSWMYSAFEGNGQEGSIRHLIWSDILQCEKCHNDTTLWDSCVSRAPATIASSFKCAFCKHENPLGDVERVVESHLDKLIDKRIKRRKRHPVWVYGISGKKYWSRKVSEADIRLIKAIEKESIPDTVPNVAVPWGDLYRRGYHQGISHLHHFYTRRNLTVFGRLWKRTEAYSSEIRDALRFWLLSYNTSHATVMTRVVAKSGQKDLVVTGAQPGVLYVSGLPVEKNLLLGLRRKLSTISNAFKMIHGCRGRIDVHQKSSCNVNLMDNSIDYVFTDPPFGGNIPYSEISFLNEAWLGCYTNRTEEAIVSKKQGKNISKYQNLLASAFSEIRRILKPKANATLVFHSTSADIWNAFQSAYTKAGLSVECAGVLDKTQGSFKQVTAAGAVRGDPVLLLRKEAPKANISALNVWSVAEQLFREAIASSDPGEKTAQRLYSRLVSYYLSIHQKVPVGANSFYNWYINQPLGR